MKTEEDLLEEYVKKLELIMESYVKGDICSIEYSTELERLEIWYSDEEIKLGVKDE